MNSREGRTASAALAITEKKPHKVGGYNGIFFQLFEWNRRLAKKKLFSKKLLPQVRSKKFGGDDKQPKLRLIADENSGGFPNVKKDAHEKQYVTRAPGLVAKLMGLDSMPAVQKSKSRKDCPGNLSSRTEKIVNECKKIERKELILERVDGKNEWRPQKLQKTGLSDRRPVVKVGADPLQIKTVLSRSRKHQLPKLPSSVKSPRSSGKNASKLIGAATRILEPRMQKSRDRHALTYTNTSSCQNYSRSHTIPAAAPPKGQTPCTNYGNKLSMLGSGSTPLEMPFKPVSPVSHYVNSCRQGYETNHPGNIISYLGVEDIKAKSPYGSVSQSDILKCSYGPSASKKLEKEGQIKWQLASQRCNSQKDVKLKTQMQNPMLQMKDRKPVKSKLRSVQGNRVSSAATVIPETTSFAPLGQCFSGHAEQNVPRKTDDWKHESERKARIKRKDSMSSDRKKTPITYHQKYGRLGSSSELSIHLRAVPEVISEKEDKSKAVSLSRQTESSLTKFGDQRRTGDGIEKRNGVDSFTFGSSVKSRTQSHRGIGNREVQTNSSFKNISGNVQSTDLPKPLSMSGDALSTLLEQKLKELNSQEDDDFRKGANDVPKKTTAVILQELICALTTEQHFHDHSVSQSVGEVDQCYNYPCLANMETSFRFKAQPTSPVASSRHDNGENHHHHLSPGSVLEASFSIDSCSSSNQDDVSFPRNKLELEPTSSVNDEQNTWESDPDILESSIPKSLHTSGQVENALLNNVTEVLFSICSTGRSLEGSKLDHAKGVILDAEVLLANEGFPISHFLLTELETLESIIRVSHSYTWAWSQVKGFTFDSVVEYLDSRYTRHSKCGFSNWSRLLLHLDNEMVIEEIIKEIKRWTELAGMTPDDLIEYDMGHSLGKWTDFEVEAFESGVELHEHILQTLVDELVIDLCKCG